MPKPNMENIRYHISNMETCGSEMRKELRKKLYHAYYYHRKGWVTLDPQDMELMDYAMQFMDGLEWANLIYQIHACAHWRDS